MCGICGILAPSAHVGVDEEAVVEEMKLRMKHRGPDGEGTYVSRYGVLGHRRLAVIDLEQGNQPMICEEGRYVLVFNGEIYNYLELREELIKQGVCFRTNSDTEVLLQMLIRKREKVFDQLNGMFAFAFLDVETGEWILARDHFGIKPLYYTEALNGQILFASEIKALLAHPQVQAAVNPEGLNQYHTFQFCLNGGTLFKGVHKLDPGHALLGTGGEIRRDICYWDADFSIDEHHTEKWFAEELARVLDDSVRIQLRSDVPLGTYLSGGMDSTAVTCLAAGHYSGQLQSFTGRFTESASYDESEYAEIAAKQARATLNEVIPSAEDFVKYLPDIIHALDEPVAGPGVFPQFMVSRMASEKVKVILGGQGGDEIFGGYARYLVGYLEQALKGAVYETQEEGRHLVNLASIIPNLPLLREYVPMMRDFWGSGLFEDMDARYFRLIDRSPDLFRLLTPDALQTYDREQIFAEFQCIFNHPDTHSYINKMTHFDFKTLLPALLQVEDRMSMVVSLESRVPILDKRVMDIVTGAPPQLKFKGGETKSLLKRAIGNRIPKPILERRDKMGFPVPLTEWMKKGMVRDYVHDVLLSQASRDRGIFRPEALEKLAGNPGVGCRQLWGALSLELWHQIFIDGGGAKPTS